jgi:hypothetical protein
VNGSSRGSTPLHGAIINQSFRIMKESRQTVIIVTAYGEDNYFQKKYEDVVGIYTSVDKAIRGAKADGMTNKQVDYLAGMFAFSNLDKAMRENKIYNAQVEYYDETDGRCKPCESSYMFRTFNLN